MKKPGALAPGSQALIATLYSLLFPGITPISGTLSF